MKEVNIEEIELPCTTCGKKVVRNICMISKTVTCSDCKEDKKKAWYALQKKIKEDGVDNYDDINI